jgi:hypothetical protein
MSAVWFVLQQVPRALVLLHAVGLKQNLAIGSLQHGFRERVFWSCKMMDKDESSFPRVIF